MTIKKRSIAAIIVVSLLLGATFASAGTRVLHTLGDYVTLSQAEYKGLVQAAERHSRLDMLINFINNRYYKEVDIDDLRLGIYRGLFNGLNDPNSMYMTAAEYERLHLQLAGEFQGIGITFQANREENYLFIVSVIDDGPAYHAGLLAGDIILSVDGVTYNSYQVDEAGAHIRGEAGTNVTLHILRGNEMIEFEITRGHVIRQTVSVTMLDGNIAHIRITGFEGNTGEIFENELRGLEMAGVDGMIIDLRNNVGGLIGQGTHIANLLITEGTIVYIVDNTGNREPTNSDRHATQIPYVILVNGSTASTSEILAAAVQDNNGGPIVGTQTFGKGTIQSLFPLADGSGSAIRLTTSQYLSPNGNVIEGVGITPDYVVERISGDIRDHQLEKAIELLNR